MGKHLTLLGDEAAALGALHSGISAAYGYPGTPSTEILEYLLDHYEAEKRSGTVRGPVVRWCTNEKTALEAALGVSFAGRRVLVTMKHVGLNLAADPLMNGALLGIKGGLVIAAADDPGMHSSQNEQDSRYYAAFAMIPCLEPRNQQEAYDMTGEAFALSERLAVPVLLRLTTRLSHARSGIEAADERAQNPLAKSQERSRWILLPAAARQNYAALIEKQGALSEWSRGANRLETEGRDRSLAVITSGLGGNYYEENLEDFAASRGGRVPAHLHIGAYPLPVDLIRQLCAGAERVLVIEEGQPFIEERLRGILSPAFTVGGKLDGSLPRTGELDPDKVRAALGLPQHRGIALPEDTEAEALSLSALPARPPQLCQGCPHADSYETIKKTLLTLSQEAGFADLEAASAASLYSVTADIGCYSLGANPPYSVPETIVCMGASIGMAKGAADAGIRYPLAVIGDSTFLHSGITALLDAAAADAPITIILLDNATVAMTGCQDPMVDSSALAPLILGAGVRREHLLELETTKQRQDENAARLRAEAEYRGLSVVILRRQCIRRHGGAPRPPITPPRQG